MMYKNKVVLIRADGGVELGMGHIMRTAVIARELKKYITVEYLCNEVYMQGIEYLENEGFRVHKVKADNIIKAVEWIQPNIILTDCYNINAHYIGAIRERVTKVAYIDDNADKQYNADIIINQNYGSEELEYRTVGNCRVLSGSGYLLLREDFRSIEAKQLRENVTDILVTVGGGDPYNYTDTILTNLGEIDYRLHVVIGGNFPYEHELKNKYIDRKIIWHNQPKMSELMQSVDLAISACGSTVYELGILGVPTIGIILADNQYGLASRMDKNNLIRLAGDIRDEKSLDLERYIEELTRDYDLRQTLVQNTQRSFNKKGVDKVVKALLAN